MITDGPHPPYMDPQPTRTPSPTASQSTTQQPWDTNSATDWKIVLVAPISHSTSLKTSYCVKINAGEANLPKKCWVRVVAIQPLLKADLGDRVGVLPDDRLDEVMARLFQYLGLPVDEQDDEVA